MTIKLTLNSTLDEPVITMLHKVEKDINASLDTLTIGTPGSKGEIKVHGDFNNPEDFMIRLNNGIALREYAISKIYPPKQE